MLSPARRRAAVAWAKATGGLIIEEDYDGEFRYDRRAVGALQGIAPDHVMYIGAASKALAPAVGLAWAVAPERLLHPLLAQRGALDQPRDVINQLTLAEFLDAHAYDRHVRRMRGEYRRRREHLAILLSARVPAGRLTGLPAGLQAVVMLPAGASAALVVAAGLRCGISFRALGGYAADPRGPHPEAIGSDIAEQRLCAFGGRALIAVTTVRTVCPYVLGGCGGGADVLRGAAAAATLVSRHRQGRPDRSPAQHRLTSGGGTSA